MLVAEFHVAANGLVPFIGSKHEPALSRVLGHEGPCLGDGDGSVGIGHVATARRVIDKRKGGFLDF